MTRAFCFLPALCISIIVVFVLLMIPPVTHRFSYLAAIIDKEQLLQTVRSPRVILVGGSNLAFGVDSQVLSEKLHIPVINMGLHANLGLRFMLRQVERCLRNGDIVVVSPEDEQFLGQLNGGTELAEILYVFPCGVFSLSLENVPKLAEAVGEMVHRKVKFWSAYGVRQAGRDSIYDRGGFNSCGDVVSHLVRTTDHSHLADSGVVSGPLVIDGSAIDLLGRFAVVARARGAVVLLTFPCLCQSVFNQPYKLSFIAQLQRSLRQHPALMIISRPENYAFADDCFFNTVYHLAKVARLKRSQMLAEDISRYIASKADTWSSKQDQVQTVPGRK